MAKYKRGKYREEYYRMIFEYIRRRKVLREKHGKKFMSIANPAYAKAVKNTTKKIQIWRKAIKRIDERNEKMNKAIKQVNYYFQVSIKNREQDQKTILARNIYYKYTIEQLGVSGVFVSRSIGRYPERAALGRQKLNRSFKTNPEMREKYYKFKSFVELNKKKAA